MNEQQVLLAVRDLRISYDTRTGRRQALAGIDFTVQRGEILAIVGESGSGKSTTASALIGLLPAQAQFDAASIQFAGQELRGASERQWQAIRGQQISLVPQDPGLSLDPLKRIDSQLRETIKLPGAPPAAVLARCLQLLDEVGLEDPARIMRAYPHQLSGGMRQRVLIAMALANAPALIIADEPTSALDVAVQRQILDSLHTLSRARGCAVLLITHDLSVALERADRVLVMRHGRIVEAGPAHQVLRAPQHAYTRQLLQASPSLHGAVRGEPASAPAPLLQVDNLRKVFAAAGQPARVAVADVSLHVPRHGTTSIVGASGSGKSTTARLLLGLEQADGGTLRFAGQDITQHSSRAWRELRRQIQVVYQNPNASLNPRLTLEQIISEPLQAFAVGDRAWRKARVASLLEQVELSADMAQRYPRQLSGGQLQRVAIARALALEPQLLVLDEPLSALDAAVQGQILKLLASLQTSLGLSYLFISHDLAVVRQISDHVVVMHAGRVVEQGSAGQIFLRPQHPYTQTLLAAAPGQANHSAAIASRVASA
jgi:peptide/nickel transport system ATP-binding protein